VGSPRGQKPCQQTCSGVGSSLHGSTRPATSLLQHGLPTGSHPPLGTHLIRHGVPSTGCRWKSAPLWTSMGCGGSLPRCGLHHGLQGKISALAPGAPPLPPSALSLVSAELLFSHRLTPLSRLLLHSRFFPVLTMLSRRRYHHYRLTWHWPAVGPSQSHLALALSDKEEVSSSFSKKPSTCNHPTTKPCMQTHNTEVMHTKLYKPFYSHICSSFSSSLSRFFE